MSAYVLIENGVVVQKQPYPQKGFIQAPVSVFCGMIYEAETGGFVTPPSPPEPVPQSITPRQARLALLEAGLLSQVDTAIASLASPARDQAQIEWEYATAIDRSSEWINQLGGALGLDDAGIDDLFKTASKL